MSAQPPLPGIEAVGQRPTLRRQRRRPAPPRPLPNVGVRYEVDGRYTVCVWPPGEAVGAGLEYPVPEGTQRAAYRLADELRAKLKLEAGP